MMVGLIFLAAAMQEQPVAPGATTAYETKALAESWAIANHRRMDANGDGYVTRAEIGAFVTRSMNGLPIPDTDAAHPLPPGSEAVFAAADTDHDGRLSSAEAVAAADREFAATDANHDGLVSPDERMAHIGKELGAGHLPFGARSTALK